MVVSVRRIVWFLLFSHFLNSVAFIVTVTNPSATEKIPPFLFFPLVGSSEPTMVIIIIIPKREWWCDDDVDNGGYTHAT